MALAFILGSLVQISEAAKCPNGLTSTQIKCIGIVEGKDDFIKKKYKYAIIQEKDDRYKSYRVNAVMIEGQTVNSYIPKNKAMRIALKHHLGESPERRSLNGTILTHNKQPQRIKTWLHFKNGLPTGYELEMILRDKKGKAKKPISYIAAWPEKFKAGSAEAKPKDLLQCPDSDRFYNIQCIGYLENYDGKNDIWYKFIAYKKTDKKKSTWEVLIEGDLGATLSDTKLATHLKKSPGKNGVSIFTQPQKPRAKDPRSRTLKIHHSNGKPKAIELISVTRNLEGKALPGKSLKINWDGNFKTQYSFNSGESQNLPEPKKESKSSTKDALKKAKGLFNKFK